MLKEIAREAHRLRTTGEYNFNNIAGIIPTELDPTQLLLVYARFWGQPSLDSIYDAAVDAARDGRGFGSTPVWKVLTFEHPNRFGADAEAKVRALYSKYRWDLLTKENLLFGDTRGLDQHDLSTLRDFYGLDRTRSTSMTACAYNWFYGYGEESDNVQCAHDCDINSFSGFMALMHGINALWSGHLTGMTTGLDYYLAFNALLEGRSSTAVKLCTNRRVLERFADTYLDRNNVDAFNKGYNFIPVRPIEMFTRLQHLAMQYPYYSLVPGANRSGMPPCINWDVDNFFNPNSVRKEILSWANCIISGATYRYNESTNLGISYDDAEKLALSFAYAHTAKGCREGYLAVEAAREDNKQLTKHYIDQMPVANKEEVYIALLQCI